MPFDDSCPPELMMHVAIVLLCYVAGAAAVVIHTEVRAWLFLSFSYVTRHVAVLFVIVGLLTC